MNYSESMSALIRKIRILRARLISYGYSSCQVNDIILDNFLNVPCSVDWFDLGNTSAMYLLKQNLKLESSESQLVMCLMKHLNSNTKGQQPKMFLDLIQGNSLLFGIDLENSSSDSGENQGYSLRAARESQRRLRKPDRRKSIVKRNRQVATHEQPPRKKAHIEQKKNFKRMLEDREVLEEEKPEKKLKRQ